MQHEEVGAGVGDMAEDGGSEGSVSSGAAPAGAGLLRGDDGMATAEYAIVTLAAAGFAGLLAVILRSPEVREAITSIIRSALAG